MFMESSFKRYPVVSDNRLVGNISRSDVLRAIDALRGKYPV
ncbi:CBS domain-containing protein [Algiphilus sp.]